MGLIKGIKGYSMQKALEYERSQGKTERDIYDDLTVAVIEYLGGKRSLRIVDGRAAFVVLGAPQ